MINYARKIFLALLAAAILNGLAYGSSFTRGNAGSSGATFLKMGRGVRAIGMGEAYSSIGGDVDSSFWNPAGLNDLENMEISAMHANWFAGIYYDYINFAMPLDNSTLGLSVSYLGMDKIEKFYTTGSPADGTYSPYDMVISGSYARIAAGHMLGVNIKAIKSDIDGEQAMAFAADLGHIYKFMDGNLAVGTVLQNMGTEIKFRDKGAPMPFNIKSGLSYSGFAPGLLVAADINFPIDNSPSFNIGAEYSILAAKDMALAVRTGIMSRGFSDYDEFAGVTAGGGINYRDFAMDYAWAPYGELNSTHRISLKYSFGSNGVRKDLAPVDRQGLMRKYFMEGHKLFGQEKYARSIEKFIQVLEIAPNHNRSIEYIQRAEQELMKKYFMEGHSLFADGRYRKAIEQFEKVLEINPGHLQSNDYIRRARENIR